MSQYIVKDKRCPCECDENGVLLYIACPTCGKILLMCDEIGNVFDNLSDPLKSEVPQVIWKSEKQRCPYCKKVYLSEFISANEKHLKILGLTEDEYEVASKYVTTIKSMAR